MTVVRPVLLLLAILVGSPAWASCESSPKPIEDERSVDTATLVLNALGGFYLLDSCVRISRSQFGNVLTLGYLNNFPGSEAPTFYVAKVKRTMAQDQRTPVSLVRSPGWYLGSSGQAAPKELPEIRGDPYRGTLAGWNEGHVRNKTPDDLRSLYGIVRPWHAYIDTEKSAASTDDITFWRIDPAATAKNIVITNYLIRFTPSHTFKLLSFVLYIQEGVQAVELSTTSPIDGLSQTRALMIVP